MSSSKRYYEMYIDVHVPGQWTIRSPVNARGEKLIPWEFMQGRSVHLEEEPFVPLFYPGLALDYSESGRGIAVVSQRLAHLWTRLGFQKEVQLIPARVEGQMERFFILNTLHVIRCVDEARCQAVTFWEPQHGNPEWIGQYRNVRGLKIDPMPVGDINIFRPWGWAIALIVSERVKLAMEEEGISGARFVEV